MVVRGNDSREPADRGHIDDHIVGDLLTALAANSRMSQRQIAGKLGIALGLANAYLRHCVRKGLIKINQIPPRRYAYYLTPKGFKEKSRLTATYLSASLAFFRQARGECAALLQVAEGSGWRSIALLGESELTHIAVLCALEHRVEVIAVVQPDAEKERIAGVPCVLRDDPRGRCVDGWLVTAIKDAQDAYDWAVAEFGRSRVLVPSMLGISMSDVSDHDQYAAGSGR